MPQRLGGPIDDLLPVLSVLIPASNEEALIGPCLDAVLNSVWPHDAPFETIVISNGGQDRTTDIALDRRADFAEQRRPLLVLEREEGGKTGALNAGDRIARGAVRLYLDADVTIAPSLLHQIYEALNTVEPRFASGSLAIARAETWATKAYARIYAQVPFMRHGVPGAGLFAVNAAGRLRWDRFPDIISDDTFVRLSFRPQERIGVEARYSWPLVEGWRNLVRVRRRQNAGVDEIKERYPALAQNDDKPAFALGDKIRLALTDPIGFAVYTSVALAVRLTGTRITEWSRGR